MCAVAHPWRIADAKVDGAPDCSWYYRNADEGAREGAECEDGEKAGLKQSFRGPGGLSKEQETSEDDGGWADADHRRRKKSDCMCGQARNWAWEEYSPEQHMGPVPEEWAGRVNVLERKVEEG
jgi:hypothetical protein